MAEPAFAKADLDYLIELFNRRCNSDVIGIPQEEHYALKRAIEALRRHGSERQPGS